MQEYIEPEIEIIEYELLDIIAKSTPDVSNPMQSETSDSFDDKSQPDSFVPEDSMIDNSEIFIDD